MLVWFVLYYPYYLTVESSIQWKLLACISPNAAFAYALDNMFYEFQEGEREWYKFGNLSKPDENLSVERIMYVMLFSSIVNFLIALYVERILPGEYGVPEKWNFPFKKEFWFTSAAANDATNDIEMASDDSSDANENIEVPRNLHALVNVKNLGKTFASTQKSAVKDLTFKMYNNEITGKSKSKLTKNGFIT